MGNRLGMLALSALLGAAAMYGTPPKRRCRSKKAYNGVVKPIGPYTPGVGVGGAVYLSGQIGLDPASGQLVEGGTEAQAQAGDGEPGRGAQGSRPRLRRRREDHHLHDRPGRVRQGQRHLRHLLPGRRRAAGAIDRAGGGPAARRADRDRLRRGALQAKGHIVEMAKPGEAHARLQKLVGRWAATRRCIRRPWDPAGGPATAVVENRVVLDGFAVVQEYQQTRHGVTNFAGHGVFWWDRRRGQHVMTWFDAMSGTATEYRGGFDGDVLRLSTPCRRAVSRRWLRLRHARPLRLPAWKCRRTAQLDAGRGRDLRRGVPARWRDRPPGVSGRHARGRGQGGHGAASGESARSGQVGLAACAGSGARRGRAGRRRATPASGAAAGAAAAARLGDGWIGCGQGGVMSVMKTMGLVAVGAAIGVGATLGAQTAQSGTRREPQFENAQRQGVEEHHHAEAAADDAPPRARPRAHRPQGRDDRHRAEERRVEAARVGDRQGLLAGQGSAEHPACRRQQRQPSRSKSSSSNCRKTDRQSQGRSAP